MGEKWSEDALASKNEYMAEWRRKNREKTRESQRRYWERVAAAKKRQAAANGS